MQTDLGDYVKLAEQCISDIETLHADYIFALEKFSDISTEHDQMKYLVENKKNQMLST